MKSKTLYGSLSRIFTVFCSFILSMGWIAAIPTPVRAVTTTNFFNIGTLGGISSSGNSVNDLGQVTGWSQKADGTSDAFYWDAITGIVDLGVLPGGTLSWGNGINASGTIVGASQTGSSTGPTHAFVTGPGRSLNDIGTNGGVKSEAMAINSSGQVVGYSESAGGLQTAFTWSSADGFTTLPSLDVGLNCKANAINASGQIAGQCGPDAVYWDSSRVLHNIGQLSADTAYAKGINNNGQIVGDTRGGSRPVGNFVWDISTQSEEDLSSLASILGAGRSRINSINDSGQIAGSYDTSVAGGLDTCGPNHAYVWSQADGFSDIGGDGEASGVQSINSLGQVSGYTNPYICSPIPPDPGVAAPSLAAPQTDASTTVNASNTNVQRASMWKAKTTKPNVSIGSASVVGGDSGPGRAIQFPVTLSTPSMTSVSVNYVIKADASGTAVAGTDFVAKTGTITFVPNATTGLTPTTMQVTTTVFPKPGVLTPRTFIASINHPTGGYVLSRYFAYGTILNDGLQSRGLRASIGAVNIYEGDHGRNAANVIVNLSAPVPVGKTYTVVLGVSGGTATAGTLAGSDYSPFAPVTLTFSAGQYQKAVSLTVRTDMIAEANESVTLRLSTPSLGLALGRAAGNIIIQNED